MITLGQIVKKIQQTPPMPEVVLKVLELSEDPDCSIRELVDVIKLDQGITFKVLRLCNSAHYGLPRKVSSLKEALVFLGNNTLVNFILTSYASDFYQAPNLGYGLEAGEVWRHAVACAIACELIGKRAGANDPGLLFTGALLHDVGKIILNEYVMAESERIRALTDDGKATLLEAEKQVLGFTHAEVGAQVASHWNLPPVLVNCILYHHEPHRAQDHQSEVALVHLANTLCLMVGYGVGSEGQQYHFEMDALRRFDLSLSDLMGLSPQLHEDFEKAIDLVRLAV